MTPIIVKTLDGHDMLINVDKILVAFPEKSNGGDCTTVQSEKGNYFSVDIPFSEFVTYVKTESRK